jgi:hypothetical protein
MKPFSQAGGFYKVCLFITVGLSKCKWGVSINPPNAK